MITNIKNLLVIAAHPDDEVLGCGGTMARLSDAGCEVNVAFLADGIAARNYSSDKAKNDLEIRQSGAEEACKILGINKPLFGDFPDNQMDTIARIKIAQAVEALVEKFQPDAIFTHHGGDVNIDHRRTLDGVVTACRPQPQHPVKLIASFEVASSTEWQVPGFHVPFVPNLYIDIADSVERKRQALEAYAMEMRQFPHSRSIEAVTHHNIWRGTNVGLASAEAFILQRLIS